MTLAPGNSTLKQQAAKSLRVLRAFLQRYYLDQHQVCSLINMYHTANDAAGLVAVARMYVYLQEASACTQGCFDAPVLSHDRVQHKQHDQGALQGS